MTKVKVSFRRGPSGHLRQDPSDEARRIKDNPSLRDKSAPQREQVVKENASSIVFMRGGDISDKQEVLGEYVLQFGKYKGKSFRWLLENDVGYTLYLIRKVEDEKAGQFNPEGPKKDNLLSFLEYVRGFQEIVDLIHYLAGRSTPPPVKSEDENLVGFGVRAGKTWKGIWDSRDDGYAAFILKQRCVPGSKMYRLQQYLRLKHSNLQMTLEASAPSRPALPDTSTNPPEIEEDEELERMMLDWSPSKTEGPMSENLTCTHTQSLVRIPFFIWKPEHAMMHRLRNNYILPCLYGCLNPQVTSAGIGRPRVITGISGQYYIFASRLCCKVCKKYWHADKPQWLEKLPARFNNIFPAFITYKKAICKGVMAELRRTGKSPNDMANQLTEMLHFKYERANFAYLLSVQNIKDGEAGLYGQRTITGFAKKSELPAAFGKYEDTDGWCGVSVSAHYQVDSLIQEYRRQESVLNQLLQGHIWSGHQM
ncbi:uncharacterized protein LOC125726320 [Brienomyrus brachyistius]|uniref:uncharacterized protein LOC125726320 n=1 Tax=Brienomyrus brachyistius TaxID=42636 RepID=UPI0020B34E79|nr:uncharacterized protein LOC125726320 [Brienomyrus brachyistius]